MGVNDELNKSNQLASDLTDQTRSLTEELKDQLNIRSKTNEGEKTLLGISRQITKSAQENKVALRDSNDITKQIKKETEQLNSAKREQLILEKTLGGDQIKNASKIASLAQNQSTILSNINKLKSKIADSEGDEVAGLQSKLSRYQNLLGVNEQNLSNILSTSDAESQRLALSNQLVSAAEENLDVSEEQKAAQDRINDSLGIAGGALKLLTKIAGPFASSLKLDKIQAEMKKFATEAEDAGRKVSKLQTFGVGIVSAFKNLGNTLTDPTVILTALIKGFTAVDKEATDFARQTGQDINTMGDSIDSLNMGYVNMADYIKAASELTKDLGMNASNVFNKEDILEVAQMTDEIGLAGKEASNLAKFSKINGKSIESSNKSIIEGVNSTNAQNKSAITGRRVLDDIANTSKGIAASYAGYPKKLGEAATAAASLGMNLDQVDKIASSLLSFESSISAELEAELITGKALNLEKARQAALDNDLKTVATEITKQVGSSAEFSRMKRIEQEALAKAVGMTRDELAGSIIQQEIGKTLSEDALTEAQKQTYEAFKNREAQDKIAQSIAKIGQAFAPIVGFIADIVSNSYVLYSIMGLALLPKVLSLGSAFKGMFTSLSSIGGGGLGKSIGGMLKGIGRGLSSFGRGAMAAAPGIASFGVSSIAAIPIILALSAAVVGIGFGLKLATPAIVAIGGVIGTIFKGIATVVTSVTQGFATMFSTISMDNILPIMLLGPALAGIGAGLALIAVSGTLALPALLALTALGTVAIGLNSIFGDDESTSPSSNNEMAEVNANLKKLISAVEQGGVVMLDSNKIGEYLPKILQLNEFKIGG